LVDPEHPWTYVLFAFFRDDPKPVYRTLRRKSPALAHWGVFEIALFIALYIAVGMTNWRFLCFFLPFYYLGHCLSYVRRFSQCLTHVVRQADSALLPKQPNQAALVFQGYNPRQSHARSLGPLRAAK
jgi:hypothetical protein